MSADILCNHCGPMRIGSPHEVGCDLRWADFDERMEAVREAYESRRLKE